MEKRLHSSTFPSYQSVNDSDDLEAVPNDPEPGKSSIPIHDVWRPGISNAKIFALITVSIIAGVVISLISQLQSDSILISGGDLLSALEKVVPFPAVEHPEKPSSYWGAIHKPYPTGAFWTNLAVKNGDGLIGVLPYAVKTLESGIQVSYGASRRVVNFISVNDPFFSDLELSTKEVYSKRYIERFDNISVTMKYETIGGGTLRIPLVKGSPFVTVEYVNNTPIIRSEILKIITVEPLVSTSPDKQGSQFIITLGNWQKWLLYCSGNVALRQHNDTLSLAEPFTGYLRVSILPLQNFKEAAQQLLLYAKRYPTGASVSFTHPSSSEVDMTVQYSSKGTGSLLMLVLPHHSELMKSPDLRNSEQTKLRLVFNRYYCMKGKLIPMSSESWTIRYNQVQVGWKYMPTDVIDNVRMDVIAESLLADVQTNVPSASDPYAFGKQLGRMAQLALIADELGIPDARQIALSNLKNSLTPWLEGHNENPFRYDKTWGGLVPSDGLENFNNDFGAGWYSDHHFQYGYFAFAIAAVTKLDPIYWRTYRASMDAIIRDICNPFSDDQDFPFARHKDLFDGHSWASGLFVQGNGKGQESSSESVNAYYGVYLYGLASGNIDFTKFALTLLTMEIYSTKTYWHMSPTSSDSSKPSIYDSVFAANLMVGNIGATDVTASTWFGSKLEFLHGINMMPLTPVTALLFDQSYVQHQWPILGSRLEYKTHITNIKPECSANSVCVGLGLSSGLCCPAFDNIMLGCCNGTQNVGIVLNEWLVYIYADQAVVDRDSAWNQLSMILNFGPGGSKTNSLYWAASRPPRLDNLTTHFHEPKHASFLLPSCSQNSACDIAGMSGECCPTSGPHGINLGCCPSVPF